ncbi:MAG: glycoside hydrolase 100 family protein [Phycisphaerae bacterium]|jgi:glycogen debranching enzyme
MNLLDQAFQKAVEVLRMNVTERGFSACSPRYDEDPESNYRSVWARDSATTLMWSLPLGDTELTECGRRSLETILGAQSRDGHLPNYVDIATGEPQFGGIGNIAGIDSALWVVIAAWNYVNVTGDTEFARTHFDTIHRSMKWLRAHDSNNCGLLEIPEASDWTDLFPRSYNVLYDEVLWYRATVDFVELRRLNARPVGRYINRAARIRKILNDQFWPTPDTLQQSTESFARTQFSMGRARYLIAQITPFGFSWRCDVFANIIASLYGVLSDERADRVRQFLSQIAIDQPHPVRVLYPVIHPGEPDWRDYFLVNLQNLPYHYHNGGIWPFVGGLWVRFLDRLGQHDHAKDALRRLAEVCRAGVEREWEFTEWAHGHTGRPMGKAYQAWSAASYVAAYLRFQGDKSIEVAQKRPDELTQRDDSGLAPMVTDDAVNLDSSALNAPDSD